MIVHPEVAPSELGHPEHCLRLGHIYCLYLSGYSGESSCASDLASVLRLESPVVFNDIRLRSREKVCLHDPKVYEARVQPEGDFDYRDPDLLGGFLPQSQVKRYGILLMQNPLRMMVPRWQRRKRHRINPDCVIQKVCGARLNPRVAHSTSMMLNTSSHFSFACV